MFSSVSIILPAKNEEQNLKQLLPGLLQNCPGAEIIVIDDGSTDGTVGICRSNGVKVVSHPYNMGNGAAVKTGARAAKGEVLVFMDADGQHDPEEVPRLLEMLGKGYDMVVGARNARSQASIGRLFANSLYNRLASWMTGHTIKDLTSGFRAVKADKFREFLRLLPNGFSYPTTSTMAFFRSGYAVAYLPVNVRQREGKSHIRLFSDGFRFLLIIFRIGTLYSPLKLFLPISLGYFSIGLSYYFYTFFTVGRFTNMSALLLSVSVLVFLVGLVSEQITSLVYSQKDG
ncbi:MAG: glycosyltransferase family 2 protein [Desulfuromonadales bacterium]|nr:glycosyltransferase family 2 protein [Desulfuromonadales bacterium]